jgi:nucleotide-binding universal stress UspA family protein
MQAVQPARTRIAIKNILFATDFSPAADAAAPYAMQIARNYGAKIYGVHINPFENYAVAAPEAWAAMADTAEQRAKEDSARLHQQLASVEHDAVIGEGNIWKEISSLIEEKKIDLIVLGTHGRTGLGRALLGSVAEEILRQAPCPVLTVGPHVVTAPDKAAAMREILYATDLSTDFPAAAPYAVSLADENQARLALLYVIDTRKTREIEVPPHLAANKVEKLHKLVSQEAELWCEPRYILEQGIPAEKILQTANSVGADLIVLGAQPANWMATHLNAGTVHKVVAGAKCPVLTVHG